MPSIGGYSTIRVDVNAQNVATLELDRGAKSNALNSQMWDELPQVCPIISSLRMMRNG